MFNYLSLNRKNPTNEPTPIANEIISRGSSNPNSRPRSISLSNANKNQITNDITDTRINIFCVVFITKLN